MLRKQALNNMVFVVPKNRKPKFDLSLEIIDLNNIPLVCGAAYVKWHLPSSSAAEHRGKTEKARVQDHRVTWEYDKEIPVRLTIDKNLLLQECEIHFEVIQEYHETGRGGRVLLGNVRLNLAEYTQVNDIPARDSREKEEDNEDGMVTRRYLMQDSKINATLKVGIRMKQTEGDTNFVPPPLKSAMVIGGIAGIMNAEAGESEDMPSITTKTRELAQAQDIYRRTLAASWACQGGELPPDRLVEDLFAGGDGGRMEAPPVRHRSERMARETESAESDFSDGDSKKTVTPTHLSPDTARSNNNHPRHYHKNGGHTHTSSQTSTGTGVSGRGSIDQQVQLSQTSRRKNQPEPREITEFDVRDDLRSWQVSVR